MPNVSRFLKFICVILGASAAEAQRTRTVLLPGPGSAAVLERLAFLTAQVENFDSFIRGAEALSRSTRFVDCHVNQQDPCADLLARLVELEFRRDSRTAIYLPAHTRATAYHLAELNRLSRAAGRDTQRRIVDEMAVRSTIYDQIMPSQDPESSLSPGQPVIGAETLRPVPRRILSELARASRSRTRFEIEREVLQAQSEIGLGQ